MKVAWARRARRDLSDIGRYIRRDNPNAARTWVARLFKRAELIGLSPLGGRVVPELDRSDVREVFERTYRIIYQVRKGSILVLAVLEGHHLLRNTDIDDV